MKKDASGPTSKDEKKSKTNRFLKQKMNQKIHNQFLSRQNQLQKTLESFHCSYVTMIKIVSLILNQRWGGPLESKFINQTATCL